MTARPRLLLVEAPRRTLLADELAALGRIPDGCWMRRSNWTTWAPSAGSFFAGQMRALLAKGEARLAGVDGQTVTFAVPGGGSWIAWIAPGWPPGVRSVPPAESRVPQLPAVLRHRREAPVPLSRGGCADDW